MNKKKKKIIYLIVFIVLAVVAVLYFYVYKDHRTISHESAKFTITVSQLHEQFKENDSLANATYADQTIVVSGVITTIDNANNAVILDEKLFLTFDVSKKFNLQSNQSVKIKGRFVGYDDLMEELKMDQCVLIE